ncbi:MAG: hypothetical protein L0K95_14435, partial [Tetragenococcus koreensis]|nr:hypothetical protein [Tetragenococcus koreensis]MDN6580942.1 hypothetical protein [Tetragenococcus koreensis]MDN6751064.1 hypothetical protein [Staphylococcus equorum]
ERYAHMNLNHACLPIPTYPQIDKAYYTSVYSFVKFLFILFFAFEYQIEYHILIFDIMSNGFGYFIIITYSMSVKIHHHVCRSMS